MTNRFLLGILFIGLLLSIPTVSAASYTISGQVFYQNNTAVTNASFAIYNFDQGEITLPVNASNFSNATGYVSLTYNSSVCAEEPSEPDMFELRVLAYNSSGHMTHMMPYIQAQGCALAEYFNNSNITVSPAATIFINATNATGATNFSGMLYDNKLALSVDQFMGGGGDSSPNRSIYVLSNRNYSLVIMKNGGGARGANFLGHQERFQSRTITLPII